MKSSIKGHRFESGKYLNIDSGFSLSLPIEDVMAECLSQPTGYSTV